MHSSSLKVTENGTIQKLGYGFLFAFHSNYGCIFSCLYTTHEHDEQTPTQPPHDGVENDASATPPKSSNFYI